MKRILFGALVCGIMALPVAADLQAPELSYFEFTNSWTQGWLWGQVDAFAIKYVSGPGGPFDDPALIVSNGGWNVLVDTPTLASAAGPFTAHPNLVFQVHGAGTSPSQIIYDLAGFQNESWVVSFRWDGSQWISSDWRPSYSEVVPVPAAVLLGILGLGAAGLKLRKFA